jgi:hypothetical protein
MRFIGPAGGGFSSEESTWPTAIAVIVTHRIVPADGPGHRAPDTGASHGGLVTLV